MTQEEMDQVRDKIIRALSNDGGFNDPEKPTGEGEGNVVLTGLMLGEEHHDIALTVDLI